jgi:hypothetical protein
MALVRVVVLAVSAFGVLGCATTSGSAWVSQPEPGPFANEELSLAVSETHDAAFEEPLTQRIVPEIASEGAPAARPRLDRTVTLGELDVPYSERTGSGSAGDHALVTVIVNHTVNVRSNVDGYYAAPSFAGDFRPAHEGRAVPSSARSAQDPGPLRPGQDWPAIPNRGTSFPFKTAPASPWR